MSSRRAAALACAATIAGADYVLKRRRPPWLVVGLFDHPAHAATAALVLLNAPAQPGDRAVAFVAGSLVPDLDHLPLLFRDALPTVDDPRPVSHCLLAVVPVAGAAAATRSPRLAALAAGMVAHFARDLAVGTGVPLLWPATSRSFGVRYRFYAAACASLAARAMAPGADKSGDSALL